MWRALFVSAARTHQHLLGVKSPNAFPSSRHTFLHVLQTVIAIYRRKWSIQGISDTSKVTHRVNCRVNRRARRALPENPLALTARQWLPLPRNQPVMERHKMHICRAKYVHLRIKMFGWLSINYLTFSRPLRFGSWMEIWWITSTTQMLEEKICFDCFSAKKKKTQKTWKNGRDTPKNTVPTELSFQNLSNNYFSDFRLFITLGI